MRINGMSGTNTQVGTMGISHASDSYSKNIKNQIAGAQEKLKEISSNNEMSLEEKMKKRQEIQKQIADLNNQLRQHEIERQRQQRQEKRSSVEDTGGTKTRVSKSGKKGRGLSQASMKAIISAGSAMGQVQAGQQVTTRIEGQVNVLKSEIKQDKQAGMDTQAKEEELAGIEENLANAKASQAELLGKASEEIKEAARSEEGTEKEDETKAEAAGGKKAAGDFADAKDRHISAESETAEDIAPSQPSPSYRHVDIQL